MNHEIPDPMRTRSRRKAKGLDRFSQPAHTCKGTRRHPSPEQQQPATSTKQTVILIDIIANIKLTIDAATITTTRVSEIILGINSITIAAITALRPSSWPCYG